MEKKILVLGDGLLGSEIIKQTGWDYLSRKKDGFDASTFIDLSMIKYLKHINSVYYTDIVNCIGYTNTRDDSKENHYKINYRFVKELANYCEFYHIKLTHISTDYVYAGSKSFAKEDDALCSTANWYGYSKLLGDAVAQINNKKYLLVRTTFKPNPYPYEYAWNDLLGNFDYVDVIAKIIIDLIEGDADGVYNVGTGIKTLYELAKLTNPNVKIDTSPHTTDRPEDTTMNLNKLKEFYDRIISNSK